MKEALPYIFLLGAVIAFIAAVVCLFTPRAAIFFRNRTRRKGVLAWMAIFLACVVLMTESIPEAELKAAKQKRATAQAEAAKAENTSDGRAEAAAQKASAEAAEKSRPRAEAEKPRLVPYREAEVTDTSAGGRKRGDVRIVLADPGAVFRPQDIAATCMAAARFYAKEQGFKTVSVFFTDIPGERPYEGTQIARCHYAPDKKGFDDGNWEWNDVRAAERPYTDQERQVKQLWGELAAKGARKEADIKKAIGAKLGIPADKVPTPPYILGLREVDERPFKDVKPQGPEK